MNEENSLSKERRILTVMRKVLTNIAKETYAPPGVKHPLSDKTIQDMRNCLALITAREAELADQIGLARNERPYFADEPQTTQVIPIHKVSRKPKKKE